MLIVLVMIVSSYKEGEVRFSNLDKSAKQLIEEAIRLYREHHYHESVKAFDRAIQIAPTAVRAIHGKGAVLFKIKEYSKALEAYEQASALAPNNAQIYADIGEVLFALEDFSASGAAYRKAMELNTTYWGAYHKKIDFLWGRTLLDDAESARVKQCLSLFNPDATEKGGTTNNRKQDNYTPTFEGHWAYMGSVHPFNCRCPECWEP